MSYGRVTPEDFLDSHLSGKKIEYHMGGTIHKGELLYDKRLDYHWYVLSNTLQGANIYDSYKKGYKYSYTLSKEPDVYHTECIRLIQTGYELW